MKKSIKPPKKPSKLKNKVQKNLSHIPTKLRKLIANDVNRYLNILGMNNYTCKIFYAKKDKGEDEMLYSKTEGMCLASTTVDMRYLNVHINIYPHLINGWKDKSFDDEDVHEVVAHEIAHIATNHMYRMATSVYKDEGEMLDSWEILTTQMGRLVHEVDNRRNSKK